MAENEVKSSEPKVALNVRISKSLKKAIDIAAIERELTLMELIEEALRAYLERK